MITTTIVQDVKSMKVRTTKDDGYDPFGIVDFDQLSVYINTPEEMESLARKLEAGAKTLRAMRGDGDE